MLKRFFINLVLSSLLFLIFIYARFNGDYSTINVLNSLFVVGILMLSGGLLSVSHAGQVFRGIGFVFRKMFTKKYNRSSYFDYVQTLEEEKKDKPTGWAALLVGIIMLAISIIFSVIEYL